MASLHRASDGGPWYQETKLDQFPVEPFNSFSNLFFLAVAIYWWLQLQKQTNIEFKRFLKVSLPLLLVGFVGGTAFHATRSHLAWMLMDVLPIYILGLMTAIYHWRLLVLPSWTVFLIFMIVLCLPMYLLWNFVPRTQNTPTIAYGILALTVLLPIVLDQVRRKGREALPLMQTLCLLAIALFFRALDSSDFVASHVSIGTHWLWHSFGAATCHFLLRFMSLRAQDS